MKPSFKEKIDFILFGWIINLFYPEYFRPKYGYIRYYILFFKYFIPQKIFRLNGKVKWPVHFTSRVINGQNIKKGILCDPGDNINNYIQANNGIIFGNNVEIGPSVTIVSSDHDLDNYRAQKNGKPIVIGNNVWIGAGVIILPSINIGDNVIIGAGSVVTKDIPSNSIAVGNPCRVIREKKPYTEDVFTIKLNKKVPRKYKT